MLMLHNSFSELYHSLSFARTIVPHSAALWEGNARKASVFAGIKCTGASLLLSGYGAGFGYEQHSIVHTFGPLVYDNEHRG